MQLICLSATYPNTPLEVLECLNLPEAALEDTLIERPIREGKYAWVREMAVLSTCNRLEVYALVREEDGSLLEYVHRLYPLPAARIDPFLRRYEGIAAARHLFRVAAGLDSIALGETQILGQVARALEAGLRMGSARHALSSLFRAAIRTGKRVRSETEIGHRPVHVGSLGVALAETRCGDLSGRTALVIGTGKIGGATIAELRERGVKEILLANRRLATSREAAGAYGGTALPYAELFEGLLEADLVVTSASASAAVIEAEIVQAAMAHRAGRALVLVDLGMPRNVAPAVREVAGVQVFDMDDIQSFALSAGANGHAGLAQAEAIVSSELAEYEKLLKIIPFLGELHRKVEQIRKQELEKALRKLNGTGPEVAEQLEIFSQSLVRKILHEPTMHLRSEADGESLNEYVDALAKLFDLNENPPELAFLDGEGEGI
jgi:glutamyl-tRNA reductase